MQDSFSFLLHFSLTGWPEGSASCAASFHIAVPYKLYILWAGLKYGSLCSRCHFHALKQLTVDELFTALHCTLIATPNLETGLLKTWNGDLFLCHTFPHTIRIAENIMADSLNIMELEFNPVYTKLCSVHLASSCENEMAAHGKNLAYYVFMPFL